MTDDEARGDRIAKFLARAGVASRRDAERLLAEGRVKLNNKPVFGICGGQQLLNVVLGGTLIQHIPDSVPDALAHEQPNPRHEAGHAVAVVPGTLLHRIVGSAAMAVNSSHHQAVRDSLSATVPCRSASPYSAGSTSNAPPVTTSASSRSR